MIRIFAEINRLIKLKSNLFPVLTVAIVFFIYGFGLRAHIPESVRKVIESESAVDEAARHKWMKGTVKELRMMVKSDCKSGIDHRVVDLEGFYMISYRLNNQKGCINFPNGDRIFMIAHSAHQNKSIGDITLAMDNLGRLFMNEGHVCGGIINFYTESEDELSGADDFFGRFLTDCDDCRWYRLNNKLRKVSANGETSSKIR